MTWLEDLRGIKPEAAIDEEGQTVVRTRDPISAAWIWIKSRGALQPAIDTTGGADATSSILAKINAAYPGATIQLPPGIIRVGTGLGSATIFDLASKKGLSIVGSPRGQKSGSRLFNDGNAPVGTTLHVYGTGTLFKLGQQMLLKDIEVYYPNQVTTGTPMPYGWTVDITGHGCSVINVTPVNSYDFLQCGTPTNPVGGCHVEKIWGFPLHKGIYLSRVTDVARIHDVNFNPAANWQTAVGSGSTIPTWALANGDAFIVDGAELFQFSKCFAYGYATGFKSDDLDADSFRGATGDWDGGGFDSCTLGMRFTRGMWQGMTMRGCAFAPLPACYGILFEDTTTPGAQWERARLTLTDTKTAGVHYRTVQMATGAYGICSIKGGQFFGGPSSAHFGNDSANAAIYARDFEYDSSYQLVAGTGQIKMSNFRDGNGL